MAIVFSATPFTGGLDDVNPEEGDPMTEYLEKTVHQLVFRSEKSVNNFLIRETLGLLIFPNDTMPFKVSPNGVYQKQTYLVHTSNVEINILTVPPVERWAVDYSQLPNKSNEDNQPAGYGMEAAGLQAVREIIFDAAGNTQQYLPLTEKRDNLPLLPGQYREQFKVDANADNKLNKPIGQTGDTFIVRKNYPLVNVGYVEIFMNYNKFVQNS